MSDLNLISNLFAKSLCSLLFIINQSKNILGLLPLITGPLYLIRNQSTKWLNSLSLISNKSKNILPSTFDYQQVYVNTMSLPMVRNQNTKRVNSQHLISNQSRKIVFATTSLIKDSTLYLSLATSLGKDTSLCLWTTRLR